MRRPKLTYANVMSTIAVFLALGGTSYAVAKLPKGSVGERELKKGAVTEQKLAKGSVTGGAIKDGTIGGADLAPGAVPAGPRGPRGAEGAAGRDGTAGELVIGQIPGIHEWVNIPAAAGGRANLGSITLPPGSWRIDAHTRVQAELSPENEWVNCDLSTATGEFISRGSALIGGKAPASGTQFVTLSIAQAFGATTKFTFDCWHPEARPQPFGTVQTRLQAIRVAKIERQ